MMLYGRIELNATEWLDWKKNYVTKSILDALTIERDEWAARLIDGQTLIPGREGIETAKAIGIIQGLDCFLFGVEELLRNQWDEEKGKED